MAEVQISTMAGLQVRRSGSGRPMLLLHGWAMSGAVFSELLDAPPAGVELVAVDLPGHGGSAALAENSLDGWALGIESLVQSLNLSSCSLLGWSLGGLLAQHLALRGRIDLRRLLLVATTPRFTTGEDWDHGLPPRQLRAMQRDLKRAFRLTLEGFFGLMFAGEEIERSRYRQIARFAAGPDLLPDEQSAIDGLAMLQQEDLRTQAAAITVPSLVLHGAADGIIPLAAGEWLAQHLADARIERFKTAGHAPFLSDPRRCLELIGAFCA